MPPPLPPPPSRKKRKFEDGDEDWHSPSQEKRRRPNWTKLEDEALRDFVREKTSDGPANFGSPMAFKDLENDWARLGAEKGFRTVRKAEGMVRRHLKLNADPPPSSTRLPSLIHALSSVGCAVRTSSTLAEWYLAGTLSTNTGGRYVTAECVARREAEVRYLLEYSEEFASKLREVSAAVEGRLVDASGGSIAREAACEILDVEQAEVRLVGMSGGGDAYRDACEAVYGNGARSILDVEFHLIESWSEFPERWPWTKEPAALEEREEKEEKEEKEEGRPRLNYALI